MWLYLGVISACFLGLYDVSKKHALRDNAAMPVLFWSSVFAALVAAAGVVLSRFASGTMSSLGLYIAPATPGSHFHLLAKAVIVSASWVFAYSAMKHLPISIVSPVGAVGPVWILIGALILFHEDLTVMQYIGFAVMVASYWRLSSVSGKEGIRFYGNKWIAFMVAATLLGAASGLYDKYLIRTLGYSPTVVQAWFLIYLVPVLGLATLLLQLKRPKSDRRFVWQWSVPAIAVMLVLADVLYFRAISDTGSLISILSTVRASCVLVSFVVGGLFFCEQRLKSKAVAVGGIVAGTCLMFFPA